MIAIVNKRCLRGFNSQRFDSVMLLIRALY
jgi:hypothetical protein